MELIYDEFHITSRIFYTTTNNASNFVKAFKIYGRIGDTDNLNEKDLNNDSTDSDGEEEANDLDDFVLVSIQDLLVANTSSEYKLPQHRRCASLTLNLIATKVRILTN